MTILHLFDHRSCGASVFRYIGPPPPASPFTGKAIRPLPVAPRQIPYHAEFTYFELDKHNEIWNGVEVTGSFAMFFSAEFPGMELEFWAIKELSE